MAPDRAKFVILEDDSEVRALLESIAASDGFACESYATVEAFRSAGNHHDTAIFLLDITLPDGDGLDIARSLRESTPDAGIIMITGHHDEVDTVLALEFGADDYITKPFRVRELRARIKSVLRRLPEERSAAETALHTAADGDIIDIVGLRINPATRDVRTEAGDELKLTTLEYDVLLALVTPPNRVLSRDQIMDKVRGPNWASYDRSIDGIISRLRAKLFPDGSGQDVIKTIRGVGYMFALRN